MTRIKIKHIKSDTYLAQDAEIADSFQTRLMGLMFKNSFGDRDAIWFKPSNSIHTFFCRFPIDVIFTDSNNKIVRMYKSLKPWRMTPIIFSARRVIELPSGVIHQDISLGDELELTYV